jgi:hypothetical protein
MILDHVKPTLFHHFGYFSEFLLLLIAVPSGPLLRLAHLSMRRTTSARFGGRLRESVGLNMVDLTSK